MSKNLADERQRAARTALAGLEIAPSGEEPGGLSMRRLLAAAFRARYLVFATTLFGLLIGAFHAITTPNSYTSVGKFLFTATGAESTMIDPARATALNQETIGSAATHILNTDDLLMRVVKKLGPGRILEPYQPGLGAETGARAWFYQVQRDWNATTREPTEEEALKMLRRSLILDPQRGQPVLVAAYQANSPQLAQQVLATYIEEARIWHVQQYEDEKAYEDAQQTYENSKTTLDMAQRALRDFLANAGITNFANEKERLEEAYADALDDQSKLRQQLDTAQFTVSQIEERLAGGAVKPTKPEKKRVDVTADTRGELSKTLAVEMAALESLRTLYRGDDNPRIVEVRNKITGLKKALETLEEEARNAPFETVEVTNPEYTALLAEQTRISAESANLTAQLQFADGLVETSRNKLRALLELEPEFLRLQEARTTAVDHAEFAHSRWNIAQQKREMSRGNYSSLKVIQNASMPLEKESPNRAKSVLGGLFAGLFLGLAIVLLRALPDRVVRTRDDLEHIEGLAVIGVMPRLDSSNLRRHVWLREQGW